MKNIFKGTIITLILYMAVISAVSFLTLYFKINEKIIKYSLFALISVITFIISYLVAKGADSNKVTKGTLSAVFSIAILLITICLTSCNMPQITSFYIFIAASAVLGLIGAIAGSKAT